MKSAPPVNTSGCFRRKPAISFGLLFLLIVSGSLIYSNSLDIPFYFDDYPYIVDDPAIRMTELNWSQMERAAFESIPRHRPLSNLSFALNYFANHYDVTGYHLVNIAIHLLTALFLYFFINATVRSHPLRSLPADSRLIAAAAAMLWMTNPIHTESVAYIVQRMTSLAAMFFIMSLWLYALGRMTGSTPLQPKIKSILCFAGSMIAGICAIASKENAATLPVIIILYEWFFLRDLRFRFSKQRIFWLIFCCMVFAGLSFLYLGENPIQRILSGYNAELSLTDRVMVQWRIIIYYISLLFFPTASRLTLEYGYPLSAALFHPMTTVICLVSIISLIGIAAYSAKNERIMAFAILWFLLNLVIESSVIGIEIIFEHRTYLPSMMFSVILTILLFRFFKRKQFPILILCVVIAIFSFQTYKRNSVWRTPLVFWTDCVAKAPLNYRAQHNLGLTLAESGKIIEAISHYEAALTLSPDNITLKGWKEDLYNNLGNALAQAGKFDRAISMFESAIKISPNRAIAHYNLGTALANAGRSDEAVSQFQEALRLDPDNANSHNNLAMVLAQKEKFDDAVIHLKQAIILDPLHLNATLNLGRIYIEQGRVDMAMAHYNKMLSTNPVAERFVIVGKFLVNVNQLKAAEEIFKTAKGEYPNAIWVYNNLGFVFAKQNKISEAIECFTQILSLNPGDRSARDNIARLRSLQTTSDGGH